MLAATFEALFIEYSFRVKVHAAVRGWTTHPNRSAPADPSSLDLCDSALSCRNRAGPGLEAGRFC